MADGVTGATPPYGPAWGALGEDPGRPADQRHVLTRRFTAQFAGSGHAAAGQTQADRVNGAGHGPAQVAAIDSRRFRSILGRFATGVVAVTAIDPETGEPTGMAANSFTSVSLEPALVSFCVAHTSTTWPKLRKADRHCVNILSAPQRDVCLQLAAKGGDKFAGLGWSESPSGVPVIDGALAWLECEVEAEHIAGDHVIVVSRVHRLDKHHDGSPLIFFKGTYGTFEG